MPLHMCLCIQHVSLAEAAAGLERHHNADQGRPVGPTGAQPAKLGADTCGSRQQRSTSPSPNSHKCLSSASLGVCQRMSRYAAQQMSKGCGVQSATRQAASGLAFTPLMSGRSGQALSAAMLCKAISGL